MKAQLIGCDEKITAYMLQEFDSKKVIKVRNGIFRKNEIQQNNISSEINPSLNCEFPIWISTMIARSVV